GIDLCGRLAVEGDVDAEAVAAADAEGDDARRLCKPFAPAVWHRFEEWPRRASVERLPEPAPRLVPRLVVEPEDAFPIKGRDAVDHTDPGIGDYAPDAGRDVPRVDLPDPRLVGRVDGAIGGERRPVREERDRSAEPALPDIRIRPAHDQRG